MEFCPDMYKTINRELTLKVQTLQMQLAESRAEIIKLNADLMESRKKMHNINSVIMETIDSNIKGYNRIATALIADASPNNRAQHLTQSISNASFQHQSLRQEREISQTRASTSTSLCLSPLIARPEPTEAGNESRIAIAHEQSTINNVCPKLFDTDSLTSTTMAEDDDCIKSNSLAISSRSTLNIPMPVRVSALSPEPNQEDSNSEDENPEDDYQPGDLLPMRLETIIETSDIENNMSNSQLYESSIANTPSLISSNVSLRRGSIKERKRSSFFADQGSEWQSSGRNQSAILHSFDDIRLSAANASVTLLPSPDPSVEHERSNNLTLLSTPQQLIRRPISTDGEISATPQMPGKQHTARILTDLTNVNNSGTHIPKKLAFNSDPSTSEIGDLSDLTLMGGATCSTPNNHMVSMDSFEIEKFSKVQQNKRKSVSEMYRMPTRRSIALETLNSSSTQNTSIISSSTATNTNTQSLASTTTSTQRSMEVGNSNRIESRPRRKAAPVSLRETAINAKMRNPNSKPKRK